MAYIFPAVTISIYSLFFWYPVQIAALGISDSLALYIYKYWQLY